MTKTLLTLLLVNLLSISTVSQSSQGVTLMKSEHGILWVDNDGNSNFTIELKGNDVRPLQEFPFMMADGIPLQIRRADVKELFTSPPKTRPSDDEILKTHQMWELKYIEETMQGKVTSRSEIISEKVKRPALLWAFSMPLKSPDQPYEQIFVTTVNRDKVIVLSAPVFKKEESDKVASYLTQTLGTIQTSEKPFDIKEIQKILRKTTPTIPKQQ